MPIVRALTTLLLLVLPSSGLAWVTLGSTFSTPMPLELDADGALIVLGTETGRVLLRKIDPDTGKETWVTIVAGDGQHRTLATDAAGNAIVFTPTICEFPNPGCTGPDLVAKFANADGSLLWSVDFDDARSLGADAAGNAFVLRDTDPSPLSETFVLTKLDAGSGTEAWTSAPFPLPIRVTFLNGRSTILTDPAGDVFVFSDTPAANDTAFKLSGATGAVLWQQVLSDEHFRVGVVDTAGDLFVGTGPVETQTLAKLASADGMELWSTSPAGAFNAVELDGSQDVVVGGDIPLAPVQKFAGTTGALLWTAPGAPSSAVSVRGDGDVYARTPDGMVRYDGATGSILAQVSTFSGSRFFTAGARGVFGTHTGSDGPRPLNFVTGFGSRLTGRKLIVVDKPLDSAKSKLVLQSSDSLFSPPGPGLGPQNPTVGGVVLGVANPVTLEVGSLSLPAMHWTAQEKSRPGSYSFVYKDPPGAVPRCKARLKNPGKLKVSCKGGLGGLSLDEPSQGTLDVTLTFGGTDFVVCMAFGGDVVLDVGSGGNGKGIFKAKQSSPPAACPGGF